MGGPDSWLGLAQRAGKAVVGRFQCRKALDRGAAVALVLARDVSVPVRRYWEAAAQRAGVQVVVWGSHAELGRAVGRRTAAVVALYDGNLAANLVASVSARDASAAASGEASLE